jgi:hypothetical protein
MQFKASQWPSAMALQTKCCGPRPAAAEKQVRGSHGEPTKFVVVRPDKHGSPGCRGRIRKNPSMSRLEMPCGDGALAVA